MITFLICVAILVIGYFTYGRVVNKIVGPDDSIPTPANRMADGVDYQILPWWKVLLTQFLNIAGLGPIFG
ncbi:MAG: carbon starvation protein A, partial [Defluviitaleaceae bacterium]|nr:carbon starvation protein A [Defluviitaleaceae bacterium]